MKRKQILSLLLAAVLVFPACVTVPAQVQVQAQTSLKENDRQELNFNTNWLFIDAADETAKEVGFDESKAEQVSLPHSLEEYDIFFADPAQWQKVTWYRRHFSVPAKDANDRVLIHFDGGGQINDVYVNGAYVGTAKGTFTNFSFDITDYITFGEYDNVISVKVDSNYHRDTLPPSNDDFHWMGGLHGDVRMEIVDRLSMESVFYWTEKESIKTYQKGEPVFLKGEVILENQYAEDYPATVKVELRDKEGKVAASTVKEVEVGSGQLVTAEISMKVENPILWDTDNPYLYTVHTIIESDGVALDSLETRTGLRWITSTGKTAKNTALTAADDQQLLLNDQPLKLYGINKNQQFAYIGNSGTEKLYEKDAYTLKYDLGVNFVRTAHYSQDPSFFDACDEIGILVEEEALGWNTMPEVARPQFVDSVMAMVKRDRNHPSIILWSIMPNEGTEANYPVAERQQIQTRVKELDHTRLTIQEEMYDNYTFVADVYANHDYVVSTSGSPMKVVKRQPYVIGEWNDNLGRVFTSPYDSEERKIRQVTDDGKKLAYFMQDETVDGIVKWDFNGYLTSLNNNKWGKTHGRYRISGVYGPFKDPLVRYWEADMMRVQTDSSIVGNVIQIMNEWKSDSPKEVYVAANAAYAELWKESASGTKVSLGKIAPNYLTDLNQGLFLWRNVAWEAGSKLIAVSYDQDGNVLAEDVRYASSYEVDEDSKYVLTNTTKNEYDSKHYNTYGKDAMKDNLTLQADGSDLAVLLGVLQDANGQKQDYAYENTTFEIVSGPGRLITGPRTYMLGGVNSAYLQSEYGKTGETVVKAKVDIGEQLNQDDNRLTYSANGWSTVSGKAGSFEGDYAKSSAQGAWVELKFTGTQAVLFSHLEYSNYGTGTVTVDGKNAGTINFQRGEDKVGNLDYLPIFETETLEYGEHTIRVTASSAKSISVDAWKIFDGKTDLVSNELTIVTKALEEAEVLCDAQLPKAPTKERVTVEEVEALLAQASQYDLNDYGATAAIKLKSAIRFANRVMDKAQCSQEELRECRSKLQEALNGLEAAVKQISYTNVSDNEGGTGGFYRYEQKAGTWVTGNAESAELYANKNRTPGDFVSLCFQGTGIRLYSKKDSNHGIARILVTDSFNQVVYDEKVDLYSASEQKNVLIYENLELKDGTYVIKVMVTGETSGNPNNACVGVSSAVVYQNGIGKQVDASALQAKLKELKNKDLTEYSENIRSAFADDLAEVEDLLSHPLFAEADLAYGQFLLEEAEALLLVPTPTETPEAKEPVTKVFSDVYKDWYTAYVQYVYDNDLMTGIKGTTKFAPNANITKAQVAQVLYNMEGQPAVEDKAVFRELNDVYEAEWYGNAVAWAFNNGVVTGDTNAKKFFPNADVTREQLALMMYRYAAFKKYDVTASSDLLGLKNAENTANWALDGVKWAVGAGLISGVEKNGVKDLSPQGNASRAQVAAILQRFCENVK